MTKPTIEELEKILANDGPCSIEILPNGEIRAVPCVLPFGTGALFVQVGTYKETPAVFVARSTSPGTVGTTNPDEEGDPHALKQGEYVMLFPTDAQAKAVADALCTPI